MTLHNEAKKEDIAKVVLMPGDPLRAKYIAENFLKNYKLVNTVRNIFAYTGEYKSKKVTVMASGMGMPSMGIYCYELYKFYDVESIIRIGSCGVYVDGIDLLETILVNKSYTDGNFALNMGNENVHLIDADKELNNIIEETAKSEQILYRKENVACVECFDPYLDKECVQATINRFPKNENIVASEMESFALFYTAKKLNKKAACLLTVVDSNYRKENLTAEQRQNSLNDMIKLALESSIKI